MTKENAVLMVEPRHLDQLLHPLFADEKKYRSAGAVLGTGLAASPGAAVGQIVFTAQDAEAWQQQGQQVRSLSSILGPQGTMSVPGDTLLLLLWLLHYYYYN